MSGGVRLINCFEVPAGREEEFLTLFGEMNDYMAARPGYVGNRLHRSLAPDARYRFIHYVEWRSPAHLRAARDDDFDHLRASILAAGFTSTHAVYEIVQERHSGNEPTADHTSADQDDAEEGGAGGSGIVAAGQRPAFGSGSE